MSENSVKEIWWMCAKCKTPVYDYDEGMYCRSCDKKITSHDLNLHLMKVGLFLAVHDSQKEDSHE